MRSSRHGPMQIKAKEALLNNASCNGSVNALAICIPWDQLIARCRKECRSWVVPHARNRIAWANFPRDFLARPFYFHVMFIWLLALVVMACVGIVGYYQGALRAVFSFVGLLLAALLASPLGSLLKSI